MSTALSCPITFLSNRCPHQDLLARFLAHAENLEIQVNVAPDGGEPVAGKRNTYFHEEEQWFNYRVPRDADTEPTFKDYPIRFDFAKRVLCIGSTGWDWRNRRSKWLGFDFDSIVGHGSGLSSESLQVIREAVSAVPYAEVRKSTGGVGLHLYVMVDEPTANHAEHAALGRYVLDCIARDARIDLVNSVDVCGGNMWLWHRKMTAENGGLALIKPAECAFEVPVAWREQLRIAAPKAKRTECEDIWDTLTRSHVRIAPDGEHQKIIAVLIEYGFAANWVADHHCFHVHAAGLEAAHTRLGLRGAYATISQGTDRQTPNAFAYPMVNGGFRVLRFGKGTAEAETWTRDGGTTWCYFNVEPPSKRTEVSSAPRIDATDPTSLAEFHLNRTQHEGERTLVFIKGQLYAWSDGIYQPVDAADYSPYVSESIRIARKEVKSSTGVKRSHISDTLMQLCDLCKFKVADETKPFWIERREGDWEPESIIIFANGMLNVDRWLANAPDHFRKHSPRLFTRFKLAFRYIPDAPKPEQWHKFLDSIWEDKEMQLLLQMWMGYVMIPDCSLQKFLLMIGAPRAGKGTLGTIMKMMVGEENVAAPLYSALSKDHGLAPLVGKRLAIFGDQAVVKSSEMLALAGLLKGLSGGDDYTINPKHRQQFTAQLNLKIVLQSNSDLIFPEDSLALRARQLFLVFTQSFVGNEDFDLSKKLKAEASGIALWSLQGLGLLRANGNKFVEPAASKRLADETHAKSNPVGEFVRTHCALGADEQSRKEELYKLYLRWAKDQDAELLDERTFGRRLLANHREIDGTKREKAGDRKRIYSGIGIKEPQQ